MNTRGLADLLQPEMLAADLRKGEVTDVVNGLATITIGGSKTAIPGVPALTSYAPQVGDTVQLLQRGPLLLILGKVGVVADQSWREIGTSGQPAFQNSWVNYGAPWATGAFRKTVDGFVVCKGLLKNGTNVSATTESIAFTLPEGYRPATNQGHHQVALSNSALGGIRITPAGNVHLGAPGSNAWFDISMIRFLAEG